MASFFISSAYADDEALHGIRAGLHEWADGRIPHWMFEHARSKAEWDAISKARSLAVCLSELSSSDVYVGVFHNAYGGSAALHQVRVAFTDLEAFHAIRLGKPMLLYVVDSANRPADTESLLTMLQHLAPSAFRGIGNPREVLAWIKDDMLALHRKEPVPTRIRLSRYLDRAAHMRWSTLTSVSGLLLVPQQNDMKGDIDADTASGYLGMLASASELPAVDRELELSSLLPAMRGLSWRNATFANGQRVLEEYSEQWHEATIWHANHYYGDCSCLAARNTQLNIRCLQAMGDEAATTDRLAFLEANSGLGSTEWVRVFRLGGTLGSCYYSLGTQHGAGHYRSYLLQQALRWVQVGRKVAKKTEKPDMYAAGLAAIAGHIHAAQNKAAKAIEEFKESLTLRQRAGAEDASIAEAFGDLGYLIARTVAFNDGLRLVEQSVAMLDRSDRAAFVSRIKLKLADLYLRRGRVRAALRQIAEADAICRLHRMALRWPATPASRLVLRGLRQLAPQVVANLTPAGYLYSRP